MKGMTRQLTSATARKLKLKCRKIKDGTNKTGAGRKEWRFFEAMDAILGHKPATEPPVVESQAGAEPNTSTAEDNTEDDMDEDTGFKSD